MSKEHLRDNESQQAPEQIDDNAKQEQLRASIEKEAAKAERDSSADAAERARRKIEQQAKPAEETAADDSPAPSSFVPTDRTTSFKQTMTDVRAKLSKTEQRFSKVIHQPVVEKVSDAASKSLGRSSLLLGGFMATFIGSMVIYTNARTNGYGVSNLTFLIVLFVIGAIIGLVLEIVYRTIKRYLNS